MAAMTNPDFPDPATPTPEEGVDLSVIATPLVRAWLYLLNYAVVVPVYGLAEAQRSWSWPMGVHIGFVIWQGLYGILVLANTVPIVRAQRARSQP
jgi:hypothetical protein